MTDPTLQIQRRGDAPGPEASPFPGAVLAVVACGVLADALARGPVDTEAHAVVLATFLVGSGLALLGLQRSYPHADFGAANTVTLMRLALVSVLAGILVGRGGGGWSVPALAMAALALDGVDGWLARRSGLVSRFGARFDMEVDCALALLLALLAFESGKVGPWVLGLGLARYVFWAASLAFPWLDGPLPERRSRKAVCVVQIVVLIVLALPAVGAPLATLLATGALAFVGWSFAVDIRHLHRLRP